MHAYPQTDATFAPERPFWVRAVNGSIFRGLLMFVLGLAVSLFGWWAWGTERNSHFRVMVRYYAHLDWVILLWCWMVSNLLGDCIATARSGLRAALWGMLAAVLTQGGLILLVLAYFIFFAISIAQSDLRSFFQDKDLMRIIVPLLLTIIVAGAPFGLLIRAIARWTNRKWPYSDTILIPGKSKLVRPGP